MSAIRKAFAAARSKSGETASTPSTPSTPAAADLNENGPADAFPTAAPGGVDLRIDIPGQGPQSGPPGPGPHDKQPVKRKQQQQAQPASVKDESAERPPSPPTPTAKGSTTTRPSFHSRESGWRSEYKTDYADGKSPYTNPNHYSAQPETYHRRSFSSGPRSGFTMSSMQSPPATATPAAPTPAPASTTPAEEHPPQRSHSHHSQKGQHSGAEVERLEQDTRREKYWKRWGCYLSERQWGTVREDYSADGNAWSHFPHEIARSRTYRWGEDGIAGVSDNHGRLCFSVALWNGKDRMLKERLFGTANNEGNHGEDVKEMYWYLDNTPTHSYMKMLYKYPQEAYPYEQLVRESQNRSREVAEFELTDTDRFDDDRYWDVFVEYAKDTDEPNAISARITAYNRGPEPADLHIIPQLFFRNTWSWPKEEPPKPRLRQRDETTIQSDHDELGRSYLYCSTSPAPSAPPKKRGAAPELVSDEEVVPELLFTENETNFERLYNGQNKHTYAKDAFHDHIIPWHRLEKDQPKRVRRTRTVKRQVTRTVEGKAPNGDAAAAAAGDATPTEASPASHEITEEVEEEEEYDDEPEDFSPPRDYVNPDGKGTKAGAHYTFRQVPANGGCAVVRLKLTPKTAAEDATINDDEQFDALFEQRRHEADEFYWHVAGAGISDDMRNVMRQALAGMLWCKQWYCFIQSEWLAGDPGQPPPPPERKWIRNKDWRHLHMEDVLSMPDKWEYPFPAVWDTAFHCIPLALVDPAFAKKQLDLFTREWYMKPDGALPAYEWNFSDVNPPVHAWSCFRVFKLERKLYGREDLDFLERVFVKLLINFTWWVNRKDSHGTNVFEGGFLGLDNIGPFNRSEPPPGGGTLRQADGTAWMAFYACTMLNMALELAKHNPTYEDIASKFFEHFIFISDAMTFPNPVTGENVPLWDDDEGFYFDALQFGAGEGQKIPVRSLVGLIPLYATLTLEPSVFKRFPSFAKRVQWFIDNRPELADRNVLAMKTLGRGDRRLLSMVNKERLERILKRMLDETEFLSDFGIRSLSKHHQDHPYSISIAGEEHTVSYWPGDSHSPMFGGNSNWRGPIWLAVNHLLIESLQRQYLFYGDSLVVECPTGSGNHLTLSGVAEELQHRMIRTFTRDEEGRRPCNGGNSWLDLDPHCRHLVHFHEFFHGDSGKGLGAQCQTGWTGIVANAIASVGATYNLARTPRTPKSLARHYFDDHVTDDGKSEMGSTSYMTSRAPSPEPQDL